MAKSRKKIAVVKSPGPADTSFNPSEFDPALQQQAAAIVQEVANNTMLPNEREAAHENGHASRFTTHRQNGQSHADAVGKREAGFSPAGKQDRVIGAWLREYQDPEHSAYHSVIGFTEPLSGRAAHFLSKCGFEKVEGKEEYCRPVPYASRQKDRVDAERVFDKVCGIVRQERGINHDYGGVA